METILSVLHQDTACLKVIKSFAAKNQHTMVYGLTGAQKCMLLAASWENNPKQVVIITNNAESISAFYSDLTTFLPGTTIVELPAVDIVTFTAEAKSIDLMAKRMDVLGRIARNEKLIVLATTEAIIQKVTSKDVFLRRRFILEVQKTISRDETVMTLVNYGYQRVEQVESFGQFSIRGGIIDIFALNMQAPVRIELFDDEIDSIRMFDPITQRSLKNIQQIDILPVIDADYEQQDQAIFTYLDSNAVIVFDESTRVRENIAKYAKERPELKRRILNWTELIACARSYNVFYMSLLLGKVPHVVVDDIIHLTAKQITSYHRQFELLVNEIRDWQTKKYFIVILMTTKEKCLAIQRNLGFEGIAAIYQDEPVSLIPGTVLICPGTISDGFELPDAKLSMLAEVNIAGRQKKKRHLRVAKGQQIQYFRDINIGDYVVHVNHGIGKYAGVETLTVGEIKKDYLHIKYAGEDRLYVPTDQVHLLHKYIGAEGQTPRLNRMGGTDWQKAKTKAKGAVADLAKDLLSLYAERQMAEGFAFDKDTPWQQEFEDAFAFEETPDQLNALAEVKHDMENSLPMDRLLCGDVGFGKTEIAIRAAFKAVMNGKQVAVLVPTTVLAQQHYQTFSMRFADFGPTVDVISRFRSMKQQTDTLRRLAAGKVDVLIGTHRLLQQDVVFKNIGLLIVDEEQRFGVAQKERIKQWRKNIDVLTLSATPIPRTLHMSLVGVRDMSIIETPPEDRLPVQTYVLEYHPDIIRDAIRREIKRGGSVYFVYNRVQTIEKMHQQLSELVPEVRIKVAHGQMPEDQLESAMLDFYEGTYDVLLCTSIIENGLDIPKANTIIIYSADIFGLSQLYQMRGRVGRSSRQAYAYFTYQKDKVLTEVAEKRLQAIKEFTELGAGFKIAMRDLEIRGAGNLLGSQQHGHIVSVGFEMYCRLLDEAVNELKDGQVPDIQSEPVLELDISAYISEDYINNAMHKIEIYQRIAAIRSEQEINELLDDLIDRFGEPPVSVMNLLSVARIKIFARILRVRSITQSKNNIKLVFDREPNVNLEKVLMLSRQYPGRVSILPGPPESIQFKAIKLSMPITNWLEKMLQTLVDPESIKMVQ